MPDIFIAAIITTLLSVFTIGLYLVIRCRNESKLLISLIVLLMLPMNAIAYHFIRIPLDSFLVSIIQNFNILTSFRTLYAPLTEEPAKLFILMIPWFFNKAKENNLVKIAVAIGLGFGIGEAWNVAGLLSKSQEIAKYPWYQFTGFIGERWMVCIWHAAFTSTALYFIFEKKNVLLGLLCALALHFIGNLPIFLSLLNVLNLGSIKWGIILQIFTIIYFMVMISILAYLQYGNNWLYKLVKGKMKCPYCSNIYSRPIFKINLFHKSYERCPECKKWHLVNAIDWKE